MRRRTAANLYAWLTGINDVGAAPAKPPRINSSCIKIIKVILWQGVVLAIITKFNLRIEMAQDRFQTSFGSQ